MGRQNKVIDDGKKGDKERKREKDVRKTKEIEKKSKYTWIIEGIILVSSPHLAQECASKRSGLLNYYVY